MDFENELWVTKVGGEMDGVWGLAYAQALGPEWPKICVLLSQPHTGVCGMIGQWGPAVEHRELYPVFCDNLDGKEFEKTMDGCVCITESLCCTDNLVSQLCFKRERQKGRERERTAGGIEDRKGVQPEVSLQSSNVLSTPSNHVFLFYSNCHYLWLSMTICIHFHTQSVTDLPAKSLSDGFLCPLDMSPLFFHSFLSFQTQCFKPVF